MNICELQSTLHNTNLILQEITNELAGLGEVSAAFGNDSSIGLYWRQGFDYEFYLDFRPDHSVRVYYHIDWKGADTTSYEQTHTTVEPVLKVVREFLKLRAQQIANEQT